jgi:hypothetical protein
MKKKNNNNEKTKRSEIMESKLKIYTFLFHCIIHSYVFHVHIYKCRAHVASEWHTKMPSHNVWPRRL